jgi:hypothetical protein
MHNQIMVRRVFLPFFMRLSPSFQIILSAEQPTSLVLMLIQASALSRGKTFVASKLRKCTFSSSYLAAPLASL